MQRQRIDQFTASSWVQLLLNMSYKDFIVNSYLALCIIHYDDVVRAFVFVGKIE